MDPCMRELSYHRSALEYKKELGYTLINFFVVRNGSSGGGHSIFLQRTHAPVRPSVAFTITNK